jgi:hypothetical protein
MILVKKMTKHLLQKFGNYFSIHYIYGIANETVTSKIAKVKF